MVVELCRGSERTDLEGTFPKLLELITKNHPEKIQDNESLPPPPLLKVQVSISHQVHKSKRFIHKSKTILFTIFSSSYLP